jgi:predicted Zn-dependent protease
MYNVKIMSIIPFFVYRLKRHGLKLLTKITDSGYPSILALGICYHSSNEIIICKVLNWKLRLMHELGHEYGLEHTKKKGHVMHPWGFLRGALVSSKECDRYTRFRMRKRHQEVLNEHSI